MTKCDDDSDIRTLSAGAAYTSKCGWYIYLRDRFDLTRYSQRSKSGTRILTKHILVPFLAIVMENNERRGSRFEATGYSSDPKHPTSTTIPGGAHKGLGVKVAEFLGLDTGDSYREVKGEGPSTAEPLPAEGEMGTGHVHMAADAATMEGPGGRRVSIAGPTAGEDVGSMSGAGADHEYADDTAGESRFGTIPGASSTRHSDSNTVHDATTTTNGHMHHGDGA